MGNILDGFENRDRHFCWGYCALISGGRGFLLPLFLMGSLTDWLDGYFIEPLLSIKAWSIFDPVADKILYIASVLVLTYLLLDPWFTLLSF